MQQQKEGFLTSIKSLLITICIVNGVRFPLPCVPFFEAVSGFSVVGTTFDFGFAFEFVLWDCNSDDMVIVFVFVLVLDADEVLSEREDGIRAKEDIAVKGDDADVDFSIWVCLIICCIVVFSTRSPTRAYETLANNQI